jgi:hypothetical protein
MRMPGGLVLWTSHLLWSLDWIQAPKIMNNLEQHIINLMLPCEVCNPIEVLVLYLLIKNTLQETPFHLLQFREIQISFFGEELLLRRSLYRQPILFVGYLWGL